MAPPIFLPSRRRVLGWMAGTGVLAGGGGCTWLARPDPPTEDLSQAARSLVTAALADLDPARCFDAHVHIVGVGAGGTGCEVNEHLIETNHPVDRARFEVYKRAAGIEDMAVGDQQYVDRLLSLVRGTDYPATLGCMAFDRVHDADGTPRPDQSEFYVPNAYVAELARTHPELAFIASVHPNRPDAVAALQAAAEAGAVAVKWLPASQRIDPADPVCDPFYAAMVALGLPLITHAGQELAVKSPEGQALGNPLRLRRPLEAGVQVCVAHCASLGDDEDTDAGDGRRASSLDLFLRLMDSPDWQGQLFGEISALTLFNRCGEPLRRMLSRDDLHGRLVNGSDYPLPAINALIILDLLDVQGYLPDGVADPLAELYAHNPLIFDLVLKRQLRVVEDGVEKGWPPGVFMPPAGMFRV